MPATPIIRPTISSALGTPPGHATPRRRQQRPDGVASMVICPVEFTPDLSALKIGGGSWRLNIYQKFSAAKTERMMKLQDVLLKAIAKKITWWEAAEIIGVTDRTMRRLRERLKSDGYSGLVDRRKGKPSDKTGAAGDGGRGSAAIQGQKDI